MAYYLGIDTSNYTTSVALYDSKNKRVISKKKLLPVKLGELGLRQSDAVFEHTKQFFEIYNELPSNMLKQVSAIGVSVKPSEADGSYMPCFLVGKNLADCISHTCDVPLYYFSHQSGHIMASLYSSSKTDLIGEKFIAFHVSGGTTDMLYVEPSDETFKCRLIGKSLDLKFGQAVDRLGKLFDMPFPSGAHLDKLAQSGNNTLKFPTKLIDWNCSVSGFENKFTEYLSKGYAKDDIANSFFNAIADVLIKMAKTARNSYGDLPIVFSGGVMSNTIIKCKITNVLSNAYFCAPEFSSDNAAGVALLSYFKSVGEI